MDALRQSGVSISGRDPAGHVWLLQRRAERGWAAARSVRAAGIGAGALRTSVHRIDLDACRGKPDGGVTNPGVVPQGPVGKVQALRYSLGEKLSLIHISEPTRLL